MEKWLNEMWHICNTEYYIIIKKRKKDSWTRTAGWWLWGGEGVRGRNANGTKIKKKNNKRKSKKKRTRWTWLQDGHCEESKLKRECCHLALEPAAVAREPCACARAPAGRVEAHQADGGSLEWRVDTGTGGHEGHLGSLHASLCCFTGYCELQINLIIEKIDM